MTSAEMWVPRRRWGGSDISIPVIPFGTQGFGNNFGPVADVGTPLPEGVLEGFIAAGL